METPRPVFVNKMCRSDGMVENLPGVTWTKGNQLSKKSYCTGRGNTTGGRQQL
jgi:hypothetical protein